MKIMNYLLFSTFILHANISGIVFQDLSVKNINSVLELNNYGIQENNEKGLSGIKVTAYPEKLSTVSDENGEWSLAISVDSRIEYSNIPSFLKESANTSLVQFAKPNTSGYALALHNPSDYVATTNPLYVNNFQQNGTHIGSTFQALQTVPYNATGLNSDFSTFISNIPGTGVNAPDDIVMEQLGSVWGKAYQKNKKRLFIASMLQRHIGFANTPADLYVVDYAEYLKGDATSPVLEDHFSLQGRMPNNGGVAIDLGSVDRTSGSDYTLTDNPSSPNIDLDAYAKVGKVSYGGIDIDYGRNTLWAINLNQKGLISLDVSGDMNALSSATVNQYLIETLANVPVCMNGELRPWALKIHESKGYIGVVCDASLSKSQDDLSAHVLSFDLQKPEAGFQNEFTFALNYTRQVQGWHPWEDVRVDLNKTAFGTVYDEPILSDIEFDENNAMYLAFLDRYATKLGTLNYGASPGETIPNERAVSYGEILKICNTNGIYEREGTGNCSQQNYTDPQNSSITEFFNDIGGGSEFESALGSLALIKGSNQLLATTLDPHPEALADGGSPLYWNTQGAHTYSLDNGSIENWYSNVMTGTEGLNSKANGIGDIELITNPAPIEVGDRVWLDSNANGIQDANESGLAEVKIDLVCNDTVVASSITNSQGEYIFSNDTRNTAVSTASHQYNVLALEENSDKCFVSVPNIMGADKQDILERYILTQSNSGEGNDSHLNDSNAKSDGNNAKVVINASDIPISGANNHSFDIGFQFNITRNTLYTLGDRVWLDVNKNGIQDSNESGVPNVSLTLYRGSNCTGSTLGTESTNANGNYLFSNLNTGTYSLGVSNIPAEHNLTVANQGADDARDSDANTEGCIPNIILTTDNLEQDVGLVTSALKRVEIGNRIWAEDDNDGDARTGVVTPIVGATVTAVSSNGTIYTTRTDAQGLYTISVPANDSYIVSVQTPMGYVPTANSEDNNITDTTSEDNLSHDGNGTNVLLKESNNYTVDFGFTQSSTAITCDDLVVKDDTQNANPTQATTVLNVLENDTTSTESTQRIKFLPITEGQELWERQEENAVVLNTLDLLVVPEEGTWKVEDNKVVFTALDSFDGQIPSPVYYVLEGGTQCTLQTRYSNVAKIMIDTPCTCPTYREKSISIHNLMMLSFLILVTFWMSFKRLEEHL